MYPGKYHKLVQLRVRSVYHVLQIWTGTRNCYLLSALQTRKPNGSYYLSEEKDWFFKMYTLYYSERLKKITVHSLIFVYVFERDFKLCKFDTLFSYQCTEKTICHCPLGVLTMVKSVSSMTKWYCGVFPSCLIVQYQRFPCLCSNVCSDWRGMFMLGKLLSKCLSLCIRFI